MSVNEYVFQIFHHAMLPLIGSQILPILSLPETKIILYIPRMIFLFQQLLQMEFYHI